MTASESILNLKVFCKSYLHFPLVLFTTL